MTAPDGRLVCCVVDDDQLMGLIQSTLSLSLPSLAVERATMGSVSGIPRADCVILAVAGGAPPALEMLRALRASGADSPVIVLTQQDDDELRAGAERMGATLVSGTGLSGDLPLVVAAAVDKKRESGHPMMEDVHRTRRLIAAGVLALDLQHDINNPLTALLVECQLMEMEPLEPEQQAAMHRIVALCRRTIEVVRRLDAVAPDRLIQRHDPGTTPNRP